VLGDVLVTRVEREENFDPVGVQAHYECLPRTFEMCLQGTRASASLVRNPQAIDQSMADRLSLRINRAIATESFQRIPGTFAALPISVSCI
jgi:hypothetical protein